MQDNYNDIINLPHHVSAVHPPMPVENRAAQFAPFAALSGYDDAISEAATETEEKRLLSEEAEAVLDFRLRKALSDKGAEITVEYFEAAVNGGGIYRSHTGVLKKRDEAGELVFEDGKRIQVSRIVNLNENRID